MSRGMKIHNILMLIGAALFFIASGVSIAFCFVHCVQIGSFGDDVLAIVYAFMHFIISFTFMLFIIRMMKLKKSMVMRTLMYYADNQKVPSLVAKNVCVVIMAVFATFGVYASLLFFAPGLGLFGSELPYSLRLILVNVCFFVVYVAAFFFAFPFVYEKQEHKYD